MAVVSSCGRAYSLRFVDASANWGADGRVLVIPLTTSTHPVFPLVSVPIRA